MTTDPRVEATVEMLNTQHEELGEIVKSARMDTTRGYERLRRWKERTVRLIAEKIHPLEGERLQRKRKGSFIRGEPFRNLADEAEMYSAFLTTLRDEVISHPTEILEVATPSNAAPPEVSSPPSSSAVFIVHGHDELNLLRLKELLKDRWGLDTVVLKGQPGKGRTLIEKFEGEAQRAGFAFVVLTPDDIVQTADMKYAQARPNVLFELGWFYGRLSRSRVCILFKAGTTIHSDLDGISRVEFKSDVSEKLGEIEQELVSAGMLKRP